MSLTCYIDTSALAKWYLPESGSEEFEKFINAERDRILSRLCQVELRCLLARRRRAGDFDAGYEGRAYALFERHVAAGLLKVRPLSEACFAQAVLLIERLAPTPLRTLDALHLAAATEARVATVATADRVMADAASKLGLRATFFGPH